MALRALAPVHIAWPGEQERDILKDYYKRHYFWDNVVGAVDGSAMYSVIVLSIYLWWRLLRVRSGW